MLDTRSRVDSTTDGETVAKLRMHSPPQPFRTIQPPTRLAEWAQASGIAVSLARFELNDECLAILISHTGRLPNHLDRAVLKRRVEFLAGRNCATTALRRHTGLWHPAPDMGDDRLPVWPEALSGSISHGGGLAAAIVGRAHSYPGLGIDVEAPIAPSRCQRLGRRIANPREHAILRTLNTTAEARFTAIFSAKEALFKALYPSVRHYFDFLDVELTACDPASGLLRIKLGVALSAEMHAERAFEVHHAVAESGHVVSICAVAGSGDRPTLAEGTPPRPGCDQRLK